MSLPRSGERRPGAPAEAVSLDTAKAALPPPNASSGRLYMFTLNAATVKKLSEMPAAAHAALGAAGIAAVASARIDAARQTRKRAPAAGTPRCIQAREIHPPVNPPAPAST